MKTSVSKFQTKSWPVLTFAQLMLVASHAEVFVGLRDVDYVVAAQLLPEVRLLFLKVQVLTSKRTGMGFSGWLAALWAALWVL